MHMTANDIELKVRSQLTQHVRIAMPLQPGNDNLVTKTAPSSALTGAYIASTASDRYEQSGVESCSVISCVGNAFNRVRGQQEGEGYV
jgi:hypothetical protein